MTARPRIIVLYCPAGGGHRAAAEALAERAHERGMEADVLDALALTPPWFARSYVQAHLGSTSLAPWAYGLGYEGLNGRHPVADRVRRQVDALLGKRLGERMRDRGVDAIVSTHFFPLSVLGRLRRRGALRTPVVGVVTDYTAHAFWAEPGVDLFCVAPGAAGYELMRHGVPESALALTGIPIRAGFGAILPLVPPARGDTLRVLITSGGFGVGPMVRSIRSFAGLSDMALTVVCGDNAERVAQARAAARETGLPHEVVGYERDMPRRLADADVVVGKPGGLTVSETLAAGRPMVLVGTCPGQEQHNEDWLRLHRAAVAARPERAGAQVEWLRRNDRLGPMASAARSLGLPHAADAVLDATLQRFAPEQAA